mgnify:FL=1
MPGICPVCRGEIEPLAAIIGPYHAGCAPMAEDSTPQAAAPEPAAAEHRMREALLEIHHGLRFYFISGGAVSRHDLQSMIRETQQHIEAVRDVVWSPEPEDETSEPLPPMDGNF